jgi:hypothetical protein
LALGVVFAHVVLVNTATRQITSSLLVDHGFGYVNATTFSPDGKLVAAGGESGTVRLFEAGTGRLRLSFKGHTSAIWGIAFSPDGGTLATSSADFSVRLWDVASGQERVTFKGEATVTALAFSPDGNTLAVSGSLGLVRLFRAPRVENRPPAVDESRTRRFQSLSTELERPRLRLEEDKAIGRELITLGKRSPAGVAEAVERARSVARDRPPADAFAQLVCAEYLMLADDVEPAATLIRRAIDTGVTDPYFYKGLGVAMLLSHQDDAAKAAFERALTIVPATGPSRPQGTYVVPERQIAAYFLGRISEEEFVNSFKNLKMYGGVRAGCLPWFFVGQHREARGERDAAIAAYRKSVDLGAGTAAHQTANWSAYRLHVLTGAPLEEAATRPAASRPATR